MSSDAKSATVSRIGRYEVVSEIGRGGMGIVYRAEDKLIGRDVAIKTLTEATPELRERFYVEARAGILSHPNIATVYELGEHEGNPFIAMEFLAGESLDRILRARGRLPVLEALSIVEQLCAGLGYAHQHGLLHRDIKPANVIVLPDNRAKIVDFGIAQLADRSTRLTKTDAVLGTFHYIAPERLRGEVIDGRSDIWSVGVMMYEMVSGELPFKGKDVSALYRVIHDRYAPLSEIVEDMPEAFAAVLDKALAKDRNERYATAEEMGFDLHVIGEGMKRLRVQDMLNTARRLSDERQFANARTVLLQAQRIDPANTEARALMQELQDQVNQLQRGEQLRQVLEQAENAITSRRYEDAVTYYLQAQKLDVDRSSAVTERLQQAQALKDQFQRVRSLSLQATEARSRGDLTMAQNFLAEALQIDEKNTDLRNAHSIILREIKRKQDTLKVEELLKKAREECATRNYTEAIVKLREAAEIDPTHGEVQQLLITATTSQKEERKRQLLDQIVAEIQDCLDGEDFDRATDRVNRALVTLPSETLLLGLKAEIEKKRKDFETQQIVRSSLLRAQQLLLDEPASALAVIDSALKQIPMEQNLLQFRSRLVGHLGHLDNETSQPEQKKIPEEKIKTQIAEREPAKKPASVSDREVGARRPVPSKKPLALACIVGAAIALCAGALFWSAHRNSTPKAATLTPQPAAPVAETYLEINASPWATVTKIQDDTGKSLDLRNSERATPFRLDGIPVGRYEVTLKGSDSQNHVVRCSVNAGQHLCTADLGTLDLQQVLSGAGQ